MEYFTFSSVNETFCANRKSFLKILCDVPKMGVMLFFLFLGTFFSYGQFDACANNNNSAPPFTVAQANDPSYGATLELATSIIGPGDDFCIGNDPGKDTENGFGSFLFTGVNTSQPGCPTQVCFSPRQGCGEALGNVCVWIEDPDNPGEWLVLGEPNTTGNEICVLLPPGANQASITISRPGQGPVSVNNVIVSNPPALTIGQDINICAENLPINVNLTNYELPGLEGGVWSDAGVTIGDPTSVPINGTVGTELTFTYTYDFTGDVGYDCFVSENKKITITENCCQPPVINCPSDVTIECGTSIDPTVTGNPTSTEGCGTVAFSYNDIVVPSEVCSNTTTITRTWTATDEDNNIVTCNQVITMSDTLAPTFDAAPSAVSDIACDATLPVQQTLTASDDCSTLLVVPSVDPYTVDICAGYAITYRWTATDNCGNSSEVSTTFNVLPDGDAPVFDAAPSAVSDIACDATLPVQQTLTASDDCSTLLVVPSVDPYTVDICAGYAITYRWTATDNCGNSSEVSTTFNVLPDTLAPTFDAAPSAVSDIACDATLPVQQTLTASDDCSTLLVVPSVDPYTVDICAGYAITYRWTATDNCGNSSEVSTTFNVLPDTLAPTFDAAPSAVSDIACDATLPVQQTLTASDDCSTLLVVPSVDPYTVDICAGYAITYRWTATDNCGNSSEVSTTFNVLPDTLAPTFDAAPNAVSDIACDATLPVQQTLTASDDCSTLSVVPSVDPYTVDICAGYAITYRWTATDNCGNSSEVSTTFNVLPDTLAPTFDAAPSAVSDIACDATLPVQQTLTASDDCSTLLVVPSVDPYTVDICAGYAITYRWTATDNCGNSSEVSTTFNVLPDGDAPVFDAAPVAIGDIACDATLPVQQTLTASDDCSTLLVVPSVDPYTVDICAGYAITYRWTATDNCGNSSEVSTTFNVLPDTLAPTFDAAPSAVSDIACDATLPVQQTLTASDDCSTLLVVPSVDPYTVDICAGYAITYRWTATDNCGNSSEVSTTFNVLPDTLAPTFDAAPNAVSDIACDATLPVQQTLTASDDCSTLSVVPSVDPYTVDICAGYAITYRWTATDNCGNSSEVSTTFNVLPDTLAPTFDAAPSAVSDIACDATLPVQQTLTASDDCSTLLVVPSVDPYTVDICAGYAITYRWTATDNCGNSSEVSTTFNVLPDTLAPTFDAAPSAVSDIACDATLPVQQTLTASDDCSTLLVVPSVDPYTVDICAGYAITYRWTATDNCGNSSEVSTTFNVLPDGDAPVFDAAPVAIGDIACDATLPVQQTLTASDDCSTLLVVPSVDPYTVDICAGYAITYRWTATDNCGNSSEVSTTFNVLPDTLAPTFDAAPSAVSDIACDATLPVQQTLTASDDCSTLLVVPSVDPYTVDICAGYAITYRWTATDNCGNSSEVSTTFNVLPDGDAPVFDAAPSAVSDIACDATLPVQQTLTASDDCSTLLVVPSVDPYTVDICAGYAITYRWTATDNCGNSSEVSTTFNVLPDGDAPVFDAAPSAVSDIACDATLPVQQTLTASDDCSTLSVVPSVDPYTVDICAGYAVTYRWTATDNCGNSSEVSTTFNVLPDTLAPTFDAAPSAVSDIACDATLPVQQTLTASDDCSTLLVVPSVDPYTVDICAGYAITYRWTATDNCGNSSEVSTTFNVLPDGDAPVFDAAPSAVSDIACDATLPVQQTLTASDDCSTLLVVPSVDPYTVDICAGYAITYRWTATDNCGNSSEVSTTFNVLPDGDAPVFDAAPSAVSDIACDATLPVQQTLTASDDCSTLLVVPSVDPYTVDICAGYAITYRWTATDNCGNSSEVSTTFNVLPDTLAPTFDAAPSAVSDIACDATLPVQQTLTASDDCSTLLVVPSVDPYTVDICAGYAITYRWTATDNCGNSSEVSTTFNVLPDTLAPTFDAAPNAVSDIACDATLPVQQTLTASDDCSTLSVVPSVDPYTVDICAGYAITYRWTATDNCGNSSEVSTTFNVLPDTLAPTFDAAPSAVSDIACDATLPVQQTLTASDDCSTLLVVPSVDPYTVDICAGYAITYRWTATDNCGNSSEVSTTFNVLPDGDAPVFDAAPVAIGDIACDATLPVQQTLTASDDCSTLLVVPSVDPYTVDICAGYAITYRWTATDNCGNSSEVSTTFNVLPDGDAPVFDAAPVAIGDIACDATLPVQQTLTASDDCSTLLVVPSVDPYTVDICAGYAITYRWTATDNCGNSSEVSTTFNVLPDTLAPTFDAAPSAVSDIACDATLPVQQTLTASDDCSTLLVVPSVDPYTVDICAGYAITYRWTATDNCGNSSEVSTTFNVLPDGDAPVFDAAPVAIGDIACDATLPVQQTLTASDDCSTLLVVPSVDPYTVDICAGYAITYRWTATDNCGNSSEVSTTFNVLPDGDAPVFDAAPSAVSDIACDATLPVQQTLTASDDCSTLLVVPSVDPYTVDICAGYAITYRWTATDNCGNSSEVSTTFNVLPDTLAPTFDAAPSAVSDIACDATLPVQQTLTASDDCSTLSVVPSVDPYTVDICAGYAITYRWTATDNCGNSSEVSTTFNVLPDTLAPTFDAAPSAVSDIACDATLPVQQTLTASDDCSTLLVVPSVDPYTVDICAGYAITYRWTATDNCGNSSEVSTTFNVLPDTLAPSFDAAPSAVSDIACDATLPVQQTLTASDDCSTLLVVPSVDPYTVDICAGYAVTYRWTATDNCGNSSEVSTTFNVLPDTLAPTFDAAPSAVSDIACDATLPVQQTLTASDDCSTLLVVPSVDPYTVDICAGYAITYRWTATDNCGNSSEVSTTFNVLPDTLAPTFDAAPSAVSDIACDATLPVQQTLTASDDCSTLLVVPSVDPYTVDICAGYAITYRWTATDNCGNSSEVSTTFNVLPDGDAPVFDAAPSAVSDIACDATLPVQQTLTASDDCSTLLVVPSVDPYTVDICAGYAITYRWTATDNCGNSSEVSTTFNVLPDTLAPTFDAAPSAVSDIACDATLPVQQTLTASDDCSTLLVVPSVDPYTVDICAGYAITYRWTATDNCGNSSEVSTTFNVLPDGDAPVFDAAPSAVSDIACDATLPVQQTLTASDDCSTLLVVPSVDPYTVDICAGYAITYRWTATDNCGNSSEVSTTFNVLPDGDAPVFDAAPSAVSDIACDATLPVQQTLTASDDCSTLLVVPSVDPYTVDICAGYAITYRWTATDNCGNSSEVSTTFNVLPDGDAPVFDAAPSAVSDIACDATLPVQQTLTASDDCSTLLVVPSVDPYTVDICAGYAITYRWTATDNCGNSSEVSTTFNVLPDTLAPTFDAAPSAVSDIACDATLPVQQTLTASDDCSTLLVVPSVDPYTVDICAGYAITYRWTATDNCGNSSEVSTTFNVLPDTLAPTFDAAPSAVSDIACDATLPVQQTLTASDDCSTLLVVPSVDPYTVDICAGYAITYRWTATDNCGNSSEVSTTFNVLPDTLAPTFDAAPSAVSDIACDATLPVQQTLTASDDCSTLLVVPSVDPYTVDICAGYAITYRWTATDNCGNSSEVSTTFNVLPDTLAPSFDAAPSAVSDIACDATLPVQQTLTASDDCSTLLVVPSVDPYTVDICAGYAVTYRWTATDNCGNSSEVSTTFNVLPDTLAPSFDAAPSAVSDIACDATLPVQQTLTASDDCSTLLVVPSVDPYTVDICAGYAVTYRWTATDNCGNSSEVSTTFNVLPDTLAPTFDAAPSAVSDIACDATLPVQQTLTASDDCSTLLVVPSVDPYTVDICAGYAITYRWTATDNCGNSSEVSTTFNVLPDTLAPTFDAAPSAVSDIACDATLPVQQTLTASDDCSTLLVVPSVDPYTVDICAGYAITYRWTATDNCGNSSEVSTTFNVLPDTLAPSFDAAPSAVSDIACDATLPVQQTLTASDDCSTLLVVPSVDPYTVDICAGYAVTYRWTATDNCGNSSEVSTTFNVLPDTLAPTFDAAPSAVSDIACDATLPVQQTLTASDDCSTLLVVPSVDPYTVDICAGYAITYRWTATDNCGNSSEVSTTFNVLPDTLAPTFDAAPSAVSDIACDATLPVQQTLTASDDCSTLLVVPSVDPYTVDICAGYAITYRWTATDNCGNSSEVSTTFNVLPDGDAPVFDAAPSAVSDIACDATLPVQQTLTASDDCSTLLVVPSVDPYTVDICAGYAVTYRWTATDNCGNSSEVSTTFNVLPDTLAPSFDAAPSAVSDIACDATLPVQQTLTASDDCSTLLVVPSVDPYTVDICAGYAVTYRWTATDNCGNSSEVSTTFNVLPDTLAPSFDAAPSAVSDIACDATLPVQQTLTASDDCSTLLVVPSVDPYTVDICAGYAVTYRWTATDNCGNSSEVSTTFNVLPDTLAPSFDAAPSAVSDIACDATLPVQQTLTASDDCSTLLVVPSVDPYTVDICAGYAITYRWTATDNCGNSSEVSTTFNVLPDGDAPVFDAAPSAVSDIACDATLPVQQTLTASDDCSTLLVVPSVDPYTVDICAGYAVTYRWTATDNCGNSSEVSTTFNVLPDKEKPVLIGVPADIVLCDNEELTFSLPNAPYARDNHAGVVTVNYVRSDGLALDAPYTVGITTITFTATDTCENWASESCKVTVNESPSCNITRPSDIVSGTNYNNNNLVVYPSYDSGFGIGGFTYSWSIDQTGIDNGWSVNEGGDAETMNFIAGTGPAAFTATVTDANGCSTICSINLDSLVVDGEFCTFTQGYYGNAGGIQFGMTTLDIIQAALSKDIDGDGIADPLVVGVPGRSISFDLAAAQCIIDRLPGNGRPVALPDNLGNHVVDAATCSVGSIPLGSGSRIKNNFLTQTITLMLNTRYDPTLLFLKLGDIDCVSFPNALFRKLGANATIYDLIICANEVLGGEDGCGLKPGQLTDVIGQINDRFDECQSIGSGCPIASRNEVLADKEEAFKPIEMSAYPVPFNTELNLSINISYASKVKVELFDLQGRLIISVNDKAVVSGNNVVQLRFDDRRLPEGLFMVKVSTNKEVLMKKVFSKNN
ncbi:hypothetical protein CW736_13060 [Nonlabens sp. MB-3u-79]|uniref:T9SS type A sorting domain-containing protein n=1 Tax=Nonlabens sp. MB-3u-79 TaxID=2058134 RepID=UPI000C31754F|nr:T9SS type A sorting domain-containing protein [Nonlabens sp. MB-3u-79]AUC80246.1 hypothetical protein CW736_13060 [Nonlabens sp. MB-3u-79]